MIKSMTGFSSARVALPDDELSLEVKSVNHKFCEVKVRMPREMSSWENDLIKSVKSRVARGSLDVIIKRTNNSSQDTVPTVDVRLAKSYWKAFQELSKELDVVLAASIKDVLAQPGVLRLAEPSLALDSVKSALEGALSSALDSLDVMRSIEGKAIAGDLLARAQKIDMWVKDIELLAPQSVFEYRERIAARISELLGSSGVDPQRLTQEVAYMAERIDVTEEITRLRSHLAQFHSYVQSSEPVGRKLDFLVQEMHREVNTIGSKSQHREISSKVVDLKAEIEKIREQVQNVE